MIPKCVKNKQEHRQLENRCTELENHEVYSTEEKRIGTWVNGKPLYRKVFEGKTTSDGYIIVGILSNCENLIYSSGYIKKVSGEIDPINIYWSDTLKSICQLLGDNQLALTYGSYFTDCDYSLIVEYTKTTD